MGYGYRLKKQGLALVEQEIARRFPLVKSHAQLATEMGLARNTLRRILQVDRSNATVSFGSIVDLFGKLQLPFSEEYLEQGAEAVVEAMEGEEIENPFLYPLPIKRAADFKGRAKEIRTLRTAHMTRRHYQIIGQRKVGKSSLLEFCRQHATEWHCEVSFLNGLEPKTHTEKGYCEQVAADFRLEPCETVEALYGQIVNKLANAQPGEYLFPMIYLDDFPVFYEGIKRDLQNRDREDEFWQALRNVLLHTEVRFITTTRKQLAEVLEKHPNRQFSEFMGVMAYINLEGFKESDVQEFVAQVHGGRFSFSKAQQEILLEHSRQYGHHPMALQILCGYAFDAIIDGEHGIEAALSKAGSEISMHLKPQEDGAE